MTTTGTHRLISVDSLQLDKGNPRIKRFIEIYGEDPTPEQLSLALNVVEGASDDIDHGTTVSSLRESIRTNGSIIHPVIVNRSRDGVMTVIEGNTRLAIYREFRARKVDGDWEAIPAIVYDELTNERMDAIRLQAHLVGPRQWDPYSKAKYLSFLYHSKNMPLSRLIDYCGGKHREVEDYIAAYKDMEEYYRPVAQDFDISRFSGFVEYQKPRVKSAVAAAGFGPSDFATWINDGLIDPLNTVRALPKILDNAQARTAFLADGAREAIKLLDRPEEHQVLGQASLLALSKALLGKLRDIQFSEVKTLADHPDSDKTQSLLELLSELQQIQSYIDQ